MSYQGWKNYSTWNVAKMIDNNQEFQETIFQIIRGKTKYEAAGELKALVKGVVAEHNGVAGDLLVYALGNVDWPEIVEHLVEG